MALCGTKQQKNLFLIRIGKLWKSKLSFEQPILLYLQEPQNDVLNSQTYKIKKLILVSLIHYK